jgi:hypothetical protein
MSTNFKTTFTGLKSTSQNTFIQILAQASVKPAYFPLYYRGRSTYSGWESPFTGLRGTSESIFHCLPK